MFKGERNDGAEDEVGGPALWRGGCHYPTWSLGLFPRLWGEQKPPSRWPHLAGLLEGLEVRGQWVPSSKAELRGPRRTHQVQPQGCPHSAGLKEGGPQAARSHLLPRGLTTQACFAHSPLLPQLQGLQPAQPGFKPPPSLTQELPQWLPAGLRQSPCQLVLHNRQCVQNPFDSAIPLGIYPRAMLAKGLEDT